jgi:tetratricopeptide (TPR) repeat protein
MPEPPPSATDLDARLRRLASTLRTDPARSVAEARAVLLEHPGHPLARLFLGLGLRESGDVPAALGVLEPLAVEQPGSAAVLYELGATLGAAGRHEAALDALRQAVALQPDIGEAWRLIAEQLVATGDPAGADAAWANQRAVALAGSRLRGPLAALCANRLADAERTLRAHLATQPDDPAALALLAELALRARRWEDARNLLARSLDRAPGFDAARRRLALALHELNRNAEALAELDRLAATQPADPELLNLRANVLGRLGEHERAIDAFESVLAGHPASPRIWLAYGDALKTAGRVADGIAAYRQAIALAPAFGEAWWSLANLKTFGFTPEDVAAMEAALARTGLGDDDRLHLGFALGKAHEDAGRHEAAFRHYAAGNRLRRAAVAYDATATTAYVERTRRLLTADFFARRRSWGASAPDPIFVVGLPRSGSTLVEQILASHPAVEGTMELPEVTELARSLTATAATGRASGYPEVLGELAAADCRALGEQFLERTRTYRRSGRPRFIDKMPNNWLHAGFIHLMLPAATIIDVRREPMACGWSCYRQHFARGQHYTYALEDLGRYYRDYVALLAHLDVVLPGRIYRVSYERLVEDTEGEVRRLLEHCALSYDPACLRFHESTRAVATASSEQVRRPVYREALAEWRNFEPWLGPLRVALGPELASRDQGA